MGSLTTKNTKRHEQEKQRISDSFHSFSLLRMFSWLKLPVPFGLAVMRATADRLQGDWFEERRS
jgi:hypothetical protein